ncbi:MAG TPA: amino acid ABC transporter permease [Hyphomicrobium sp.]|nr:amino acid ABC transporter permease [Hyphomicrobium sp.]
MGTSRTATPASRLDAWPHRVRAALFPTVGQSIASLAALALIGLVAYAFLDWAILRAVFTGSDGSACRVPNAGACWPFIMHKLDLFLYGRYPDTELWRVKLTYALALAGLVPLMIPRVPYKLPLAIYLLAVFPVIAFVLLYGGAFGLPIVGTELWGGLLLTLVIASVGIAASFPLGILLALGRRSEMPFVRWASVAYIELVRGVPLVTVLFMSSVMLPLFLPPEVTIDKLLRALVGVALFSAAYLAEVVRGGLQAIPRGQYEAADALGLGYWRKMGFVVLPQAIRIVIPGLVNSAIALFKDTSLVLIIGLFDLVGIVQQSAQADARWFSPQTAATGYFFAGAVFWIFCFGMSRYSAAVEHRLAARARG